MSFALGAAACSNDDDEPSDPVENEVEEEVENEGDEVEDELDGLPGGLGVKIFERMSDTPDVAFDQ